MTVIVPDRKVRAAQSSNPLRLANSPITDGCIFATSGGTLLNSATETRGAFNNNASNQVGRYLSYKTTTGTADRVDFNNTLAKSGQTEYSFACLFKWNGGGSGGNQYLVNRFADGTRFIFINMPNVGTTVGINWGATATTGSAQASFIPTAGVYYFLSASTPANGSISAATAKIYINGYLQSISISADGAVYSTTGKDVILGGRTTDNLRNFDGEIVLAAIWDRVLRNVEHISLAQNPWQLFAPRKTLFYFPGVSSPTFGFERKVWSRQPNNIAYVLNPAFVPAAVWHGGGSMNDLVSGQAPTIVQDTTLNSPSAYGLATYLNSPALTFNNRIRLSANTNAVSIGSENFTAMVMFQALGRPDGGTYRIPGISRWNIATTPGSNEWLLVFDGSSPKPIMGVEVGSTVYIATATSPALVNGEWYVLMGVRNGTTISVFCKRIKTNEIGTASTTNAGITTVNTGKSSPTMLGQVSGSNFVETLRVPIAATFKYALTNQEVYTLLENPWQIFDQRKQSFYLPGISPNIFPNKRPKFNNIFSKVPKDLWVADNGIMRNIVRGVDANIYGTTNFTFKTKDYGNSIEGAATNTNGKGVYTASYSGASTVWYDGLSELTIFAIATTPSLGTASTGSGYYHLARLEDNGGSVTQVNLGARNNNGNVSLTLLLATTSTSGWSAGSFKDIRSIASIDLSKPTLYIQRWKSGVFHQGAVENLGSTSITFVNSSLIPTGVITENNSTATPMQMHIGGLSYASEAMWYGNIYMVGVLPYAISDKEALELCNIL